ncbi:ATP-dependent RNA helicase ROK1 [Saitozyma sp. JCM 24511]|nr:ATP-dependent RNA helicase ROK1 [Saitozyma sp. JCM 24511]
MSAAFNLLTAGGARFDKSRFKHDHELFVKKAAAAKDKGKGKAKADPISSTSLPSSLNFFSDHHEPAVAAPAKAKKRVHVEDNEDSDHSSGSEASSSTVALPQPPQQKITISGPDPLPRSLHHNLPSLVSHETATLSSSSGRPLLRALGKANIHSLWGVQCAVAGCLLEGTDTMCVAPTGSGKTLSYVLPTIVRLKDPARTLRGNETGQGVRAVFLVPTHDLAVQIQGVVRAVTSGRAWRCLVLSKATEKAVCESSPGHNHIAGSRETAQDGDEEDGSIESEDEHDGGDSSPLGVDILIATPERLHHLVESGRLSLASTRLLVLDESDRLLSADFFPQVEPIVSACTHPEIIKCFLSATMPAGSEEVARQWLRDGGVRVVVGVKDSAVTTVDQSLLYTGSESGKLLAVRSLISEGNLPYPSLIFVQSITRADELHRSLALDGLRVDVVHGNRTKAKRDEAIASFREGRVWVLVVTEVLARGMDFRGVKVVVNYDFPQTVQSYIHRIGRTGRAGRPGKAITFFSNEDAPYLRTIANVLRASGCPVPQYMLDMPKPSKNLKKNLARAPLKRKHVGGGGRDVGREMQRKKREMIKGSKRRKGEDQSRGESKE